MKAFLAVLLLLALGAPSASAASAPAAADPAAEYLDRYFDFYPTRATAAGRHISPSFYYKPDEETLRLWLSIDGLFLTLFAVGCILFLLVVFSSMKYEVQENPGR